MIDGKKVRKNLHIFEGFNGKGFTNWKTVRFKCVHTSNYNSKFKKSALYLFGSKGKTEIRGNVFVRIWKRWPSTNCIDLKIQILQYYFQVFRALDFSDCNIWRRENYYALLSCWKPLEADNYCNFRNHIRTGL